MNRFLDSDAFEWFFVLIFVVVLFCFFGFLVLWAYWMLFWLVFCRKKVVEANFLGVELFFLLCECFFCLSFESYCGYYRSPGEAYVLDPCFNYVED